MMTNAVSKRSVKMHPVAGIFLFGSPLVLFIFVAYLYINKTDTTRSPKPPREPQGPTESFESKMGRARGFYIQAINLREDEDRKMFLSKVEEAKAYIDSLLDELDAMLEPLGDAALNSEYGEYTRDYGKLQTWKLDLVKTDGF